MTLSQPWAIWVLFGGAVGVYWLLVLMEALGVWGGRAGALMPSWWWTQILLLGGMSMGATEQHGGIAVPLSFTLPGYRELLRGSSFARAVRWGVVFSLVLFSHTWLEVQLHGDWPADLPKPSFMMGPSFAEICLNMIGGFLAGMAICLLWINRTLVSLQRRSLVMPFAAVPIAVAYVAMVYGSRHPFIIWPVLIPVSVFFCGFFWRRLGDMEWVKRGHRGILTHEREDSRAIEVRTTDSSWVEDLFLCRMRKGGSTATTRHLWGWFYRVFGPTLAQWKWIVVSLLAGTLVLGYLNWLLVGMAFVFLGLHLVGNVWLVSSTMLLPEGRREKYYFTIASGAVATLLLVGVSAGVVVLSWVFAALLPPVSLGMFHLQYTGFSMRNIWLACLLVPWFPVVLLALALLLFSVRTVVPLVILLAIPFLVGRFLVGREIPAFHVSPASLSVLPPALLACGWAFFLLAAWITYRRRDLADQGPGGED
jgi:hypothetical protein